MIALTIAGSDSGGCAGIQADLKTFSALGVFGASVITALTAQNTKGVRAVETVSPQMVAAQLAAVLDDLDVKAIKIGMVANADIIQAIAPLLEAREVPVVLDPVMVAGSGDRLMSPGAEAALRETLLPLATLVTPNLPEAGVLLSEPAATTLAEMTRQAQKLAAWGPAVLLKGGHLSVPAAVYSDGRPQERPGTDIFAQADTTVTLTAPMIDTQNTHGTGCTLSSAIAAMLAKGLPLEEAVRSGKGYLTAALAASETLKIGKGRGPVHHFHALWPVDGLTTPSPAEATG